MDGTTHYAVYWLPLKPYSLTGLLVVLRLIKLKAKRGRDPRSILNHSLYTQS